MMNNKTTVMKLSFEDRGISHFFENLSHETAIFVRKSNQITSNTNLWTPI